MALEPGTRLGPYEIVELLGKGGMGEVYRARDTRLERDVAVKVLPAELSEDETYRKRLEREAKTISKLQHPNVCTVYDIGSEGGTQYLVMEYLDGETLEARLKKGPLPIDQVLRIGGEIAEAMGAAHQQGIVHRDLKPANVMLTKTGTKVLDFGLAIGSEARLVDPDAATKTITHALTKEGRIVGTMPYMAPEQLQGSLADFRSDIWALGCCLYEMATGERPFRGETQASLIGSIMESDPSPLTRKRASPERFDWIVKRCLDKDPEQRWQSARDVAIEIEAIDSGSARPDGTSDASREAAESVVHPRTNRSFLRSPVLASVAAALVAIPIALVAYLTIANRQPSPTGPPLTSIAVLPFDDMSPGGDQAWLANGMAADLIEALSRIETLRVVAWTSAQAVKQQGVDIATVGELLNVGAVVEGSIRRSDQQLRITVQLIRVSDGENLWSAHYPSKPDDIFAIQEEIVRKVAEVIRIELGVQETFSWLRKSRYITPDVRAWELLRKAVELEQTFTEEGFRGAIESSLLALEIDPEYAQARAQLAWGHMMLWIFYHDPRPEVRAEAIDIALRILELDPENATANNLLTNAAILEGNWSGAEERVIKALQASPSMGPLHISYGRILMSTGRLEEALAPLRRAIRLDPLTGLPWREMGDFHLAMGDLESGIEAYERSLELGFPSAFASLVHAYQVGGRHEDGLRVMIQTSRAPEDAETIRSAFVTMGYPGAVRAWLDSNGGGSGACPTSASAYPATVLLAVAEQEDRFFDCLNEYVEQKRIGFILLKSHPAYDPYRDDARFTAVVQRTNLAE